MKDHEKRELVSELVGIARIAHGTEQLRDRIAYALSGVFSALDEATARAERAEAEMRQEPVATVYIGSAHCKVAFTDAAKEAMKVRQGQSFDVYADPMPRTVKDSLTAESTAAQAPQDATCEKPLQVPNEWREVLSGLIAIAEKKGKKQGSPNHSHRRTNIWDDDNGPELSGKPCAECALYDRARALLQEVKP